jgi:hypothetical protein
MPGRLTYEIGRKIHAASFGLDFYGLIQAAMRRADSDNLKKLKLMFPVEWEDLSLRYNAPGGILPGDPPYNGPGRNVLDEALEQDVDKDRPDV